MSTETKVCRKCKVEKPATSEYFTRRKDSKDKLAYRCRACDAQHAREWNVKNRAHKTALQRAWRDAHPGYVAKKSKEARKAHPEAHRAYRALYKPKAIENMRTYRRANPQRFATMARISRARKHGAVGSHTAEDIQVIYESQQGCCYYCKEPVGTKYHVDHVVPLSRGGSNDPSNLVIACPTCNQSKADKLPHEWRQEEQVL